VDGMTGGALGLAGPDGPRCGARELGCGRERHLLRRVGLRWAVAAGLGCAACCTESCCGAGAGLLCGLNGPRLAAGLDKVGQVG
jgi:hypothetical protein